jgi:cytoskeleton protein RodZ
MDDHGAGTIGSTLRAARSARGRGVAHVAAATDLDPVVIEALEADRFSDLGGQAAAKGYLRTYARHLGLDPEPLLDQLTPAVAPDAPAVPGRGAVPGHGLPEGAGIGGALRAARQARGERIQDAAGAMQVESAILACLEAEDFGAAGGQVLAKAYLRRYARHLGLDAETLLDHYPRGGRGPLEPRVPGEAAARDGRDGTGRAPAPFPEALEPVASEPDLPVPAGQEPMEPTAEPAPEPPPRRVLTQWAPPAPGKRRRLPWG